MKQKELLPSQSFQAAMASKFQKDFEAGNSFLVDGLDGILTYKVADNTIRDECNKVLCTVGMIYSEEIEIFVRIGHAVELTGYIQFNQCKVLQTKITMQTPSTHAAVDAILTELSKSCEISEELRAWILQSNFVIRDVKVLKCGPIKPRDQRVVYRIYYKERWVQQIVLDLTKKGEVMDITLCGVSDNYKTFYWDDVKKAEKIIYEPN